MKLTIPFTALKSSALIGLALGFFLGLSSCHNEDCGLDKFESAPDIPAAIDSAKTMTFVITENGLTDTVVLYQSIKDQYHTPEWGIYCESAYIEHKLIEWETLSGDVFRYQLTSSLPTKYTKGGYYDYSNPKNMTEISYKKYLSLFADNAIKSANDSLAAEIKSLTTSWTYTGFDEGTIRVARDGIKEFSIPSKNFTMKRIK